jgi:hypothetical protein
MVDQVRLRVSTPLPKVRLRVLPSLLPTQIELQNTGTVIQWRYIDGVSPWQDLITVLDLLPTPAEILAQLLTVDGSGSGLDADLLDGLDSTVFSRLAKVVQVVTATGTAAVNAGTDVVVVNLASSGSVTLQLGPVASQAGRKVKVEQWNTNATVTVAADAGDTGGIKGASSIDLVAGYTTEFDPITSLSGWSF